MSNERRGGIPATDDESADSLPVPEYESEQYLPDPGKVTAARKAVLREKFGRVRTYFKSHPERHSRLQRRLNQGRFGTTYDVYLTQSVTYAAGGALVGVVLGALLTWLLAATGALAGLESPIAVGDGPLVQWVEANRLAVAGASLTAFTAVGVGGLVWTARYYYPHLRVSSRRRNVDVMLPHAIVYMYALAYGGMDLVTVVRRMADAEETYGEVANEFDMLVQDVDLFGNDLFTAIRNARNLTPSDNLEAFLDDLLSVLDSGGDVTTFLRDESQKYMEEARSEQESFLETLSTLAEVFIVGFVAAPLFVVVTLLMLSFLGAGTVLPLVVVVYAVVPLGMAMFLVVVSTLSEPYKQPGHELETDGMAGGRATASVRTNPNYERFRHIRRREQAKAALTHPAERLVQQPYYSLLVTVPLAIILPVVFVRSGLVGANVDAMLSAPFRTTTALFVIPFLICAVPLAAFHEYARHRKRSIAKRLPDALDILASANQMGVRLSEGLGLVSRSVSGPLAVELRHVRNDIEWNNDIRHALLSLADRVEVPQLTRTCKILAEGSRSTGDLYKVLNIAAEDTRHRYRLERDRQQKLNAYTAIVVVGFLVYLAVVVIIDQSFLGPVVQQVADAGASSDTVSQSPIAIRGTAIDTYHALFFHSALVQAVGTGLIVGKLTDNRSLSGLKWSVGLVLVALLVFALV
jgi:flagellar protein FlaJ